MAHSSIAYPLMTLGLAGAISSCSMPYQTPEVYPGGPVNKMNVSREFTGIKGLLNDSKGAVSILSVHGMCTHDGAWAKESIAHLNTVLGGEGDAELTKVTVNGTAAEVYKAEIKLGAKVVNVSALVWSPIVTPLKSQLCYDRGAREATICETSNSVPSSYSRAKFNRMGKEVMLNDCLADAMIYQGRARGEINEQMKKAILAAVTPSAGIRTEQQIELDAMDSDDPLVVITSSLGSKMTFDAIHQMSLSSNGNERNAANVTASRIKKVFMAANQIPILQLADMRLDGKIPPDSVSLKHEERANEREINNLQQDGSEPKFAADPLSVLYKKKQFEDRTLMYKSAPRQAGAPQVIEPFVVVLTDPNDLLSYSFNGSTFNPEYPFVDVIVSNRRTWFGLFEHPGEAHTGYLDQEGVLELMACGKVGCSSETLGR